MEKVQKDFLVRCNVHAAREHMPPPETDVLYNIISVPIQTSAKRSIYNNITTATLRRGVMKKKFTHMMVTNNS